ncbi:hypothetical protein [Cohnella sp. REN36]|uniref:hypothetical protein n=1 Tax=Cohnella sp. REN36 TaxID=2887347 RepID=UPI001D13C1A4|nr:hypothetical protein [Cohnella sp. REN36]MCC3375817.1 hypothetical protein [Cohnella sp. REN36]
MTNETIRNGNEKERTDEAWARLQERLAEEPMHANWARWTEAGVTIRKNHANEGTIEKGAPAAAFGEGYASTAFEHAAPATGAEQAPSASERQPDSPASEGRGRALRGRRKWAAIAVAAALFGTLLATPAGDRALASILAQFRMQEVAVVNEDDLQQLFNQFAGDGQTLESINQFGSFTSTNGTINGAYEPEEAARLLGYQAPPKGVAAAYVSPSQQLTFKLNVEPINTALKRLGAKKLLPASVDGKPITLSVPETASYRLPGEKWAELRQTNAPVVTVDPSIDVKEAYDAVLDFPLLPSRLKETLQQSRILSGEIPLPVLANGDTEQRTIGGTRVIVTKSTYGDQTRYQATWAKDGQLFTFDGGQAYNTEVSIDDKLKEWLGA